MTGGGRRAGGGKGQLWSNRRVAGEWRCCLRLLACSGTPLHLRRDPGGLWRWRGTPWPMGPVKDSPLGRGPGQQPVFRGAYHFCLLRSVSVATDKLLVPLRSGTRMLRQSRRGYGHRPAVIPSWREQCGTLSFYPPTSHVCLRLRLRLSYSLIYSSVFPFVQSSIIQKNQHPVSSILSFPQKKSWYISFKSTNLIEL